MLLKKIIKMFCKISGGVEDGFSFIYSQKLI